MLPSTEQVAQEAAQYHFPLRNQPVTEQAFHQQLTEGARRPSNTDIPPYFERARHSIDIVQRANQQQQLPQYQQQFEYGQAAQATANAPVSTHQPSITSTTLQQRQQPLPRPEPKLVKKAQKYAITINEHENSLQELCEKYKTQYDFTGDKPIGLAEADVAQHLQQYGLNQLTPPKKPSGLKKFLKQFLKPFMLLLLLAAALSFATAALDSSAAVDNIILGALLVLVSIMNGMLISASILYFC